MLGLLIWVASGCTGGTRIEGGIAYAPPCDQPAVVAGITELWQTHPDYAGRAGAAAGAPTLHGVREVALERHDPMRASTRWCLAEARWASGAATPVVWDMFATPTLFGVPYGLRPCFGELDPHHPHCLPTEGKAPAAVVAAWHAAAR